MILICKVIALRLRYELNDLDSSCSTVELCYECRAMVYSSRIGVVPTWNSWPKTVIRRG
jgi:hypothetical protein